MTEEQQLVLEAAYDLVSGGLDAREQYFCYKVIHEYVTNNPPSKNVETT